MTTALLCTDGSDAALAALRTGVALLDPDSRLVVVTVIEPPDDSMLVGVSGMAGGILGPEEFDLLRDQAVEEGNRVVAAAAAALAPRGAETRVEAGQPGPALCTLAAELGVDVVVMGSRGRGGLTRALMGSVSDHVVRNASCPVLITRV